MMLGDIKYITQFITSKTEVGRLYSLSYYKPVSLRHSTLYVFIGRFGLKW